MLRSYKISSHSRVSKIASIPFFMKTVVICLTLPVLGTLFIAGYNGFSVNVGGESRGHNFGVADNSRSVPGMCLMCRFEG